MSLNPFRLSFPFPMGRGGIVRFVFAKTARERFSELKKESASPDSEGRLFVVMPHNQNPDGTVDDTEKKMIRKTLQFNAADIHRSQSLTFIAYWPEYGEHLKSKPLSSSFFRKSSRRLG